MANLNAAPEIDQGGYVYPDPGRAQSAKQREQLPEKGITLRDYFAAQAPITLVEARQIWSETNYQYRQDPTIAQVIDILTEISYAYADAMLKRRAKATQEQPKKDVK